MLSCLYGILLGRQSVGIVAHRVQHVEALQSLVACVYVAGNISERMANVQSCSRWIREHVEHVEFLLVLVLCHTIGLVLHPSFLPFLLNVSEIVFHLYLYLFIYNDLFCKDNVF